MSKPQPKATKGAELQSTRPELSDVWTTYLTPEDWFGLKYAEHYTLSYQPRLVIQPRIFHDHARYHRTYELFNHEYEVSTACPELCY